VIRKLKQIAFMDVRKAFSARGGLPPLNDLDEEIAASVASIRSLPSLERFPIKRKRSSFNLGEQFHPIILNLRFSMIGYCSS
jgi:hypothetical protein